MFFCPQTYPFYSIAKFLTIGNHFSKQVLTEKIFSVYSEQNFAYFVLLSSVVA